MLHHWRVRFLIGALTISIVLIATGTWWSSLHTLTTLEAAWIPGLHGVVLFYPKAMATARFEPWEPLEQNRSLAASLKRLCQKAHLPESCATDPSARFRLTTTRQLVTMDGKKTELTRGHVALSPDNLTAPLLAARIDLMRAWPLTNQREDGSLPYLYHPSRGEYPTGANLIRTLLMAQGMHAMARTADDAALHRAADRLIAQVFATSYHADSTTGRGYLVESDGEIKLGAAAVAVLALTESSETATRYATQLEQLGAFLRAMQNEDGSFQTFLSDTPTQLNDRFYSGEALTAMVRLAARSAQPAPYHAALARGYTHYQARLSRAFEPQYAPWHIQAYSLVYRQQPRTDYADYVFMLADQLIETMLAHDTTALPDEIGRFYNPEHPAWGPPHASSTGIYLEGLTYAYTLAKEVGDVERTKWYHAAIMQASAALLALQWTPESAHYLEHPERVVGAFKRTVTDNRHRIDQIGHAANALVAVHAILAE